MRGEIYTASEPVSPVRMRMTSSRLEMKILPSPILPVLEDLVMASTTASTMPSSMAISSFTSGRKSTTYSAPRYSSVWPFWRPKPLTYVSVMPCTPTSASASRTSSTLKGLMKAVISFMVPSHAVRLRWSKDTPVAKQMHPSRPGFAVDYPVFLPFLPPSRQRGGRFPPRPLSVPDLESLLAVDELRIGLHAALGQVDAVVLLLLGDADTDHRLEDAPDDQTGDEHPHEDGDDTEQLAHQGGVLIAGQTDSQETPDAHHAVYGDGADGIVDLDLVHEHHRKHHQYAADGTHQGRGDRGPVQRFGGDGHKTCQGTVDRHGEVGLAEQEVGRDQRRQQTATGRGIGVDEHGGDSVGLVDVRYHQLGAAVEAEPTHPQDEHAEG